MRMFLSLLCLFTAPSFSLMSCAPADEGKSPNPRLALKPCSDDIQSQTALAAYDALCGAYEVSENRKTKTGRKIALNIAVIPALASKPKPDPVFMLAGGPGQAATEVDWIGLMGWVKKLRVNRDIVLVDQRGTGSSNPLDCIPDGGMSIQRAFEPLTYETIARSLDETKKCVDAYDADLGLYTTDIAMDDLNEVREALGYDKINLYGGSYGTRAAHVYLRRHGDTVRSCVLEDVAPLEMKILTEAAEDGERALNLLFEDCAQQEACREAFPNLSEKLRTVLNRLKEAPARVQLRHPRNGAITGVTVGPESIRGIIFASLYVAQTSALIPLAIEQAAADDFSVFASLADINSEFQETMSMGMQAAVLCNEDLSKIDIESLDAGPESGFFSKKELLAEFARVCPLFKRDQAPDSFFKPVESDVPTLVLSGNLDPITPPRWGDIASNNLKNSKHIVVPGMGHGVSYHKCVADMVAEFVEEASASNLDTVCLKGISRFPIFVQPTGYLSVEKKEAGK